MKIEKVANMHGNAVSVHNLSFAYEDEKDRLILKEISIEVAPGEFVCLLGQSGCGKSTFLRLIAGLEKPTKGEILTGGMRVNGANLSRGVVFQDYGLFPWMTAGDNIMLALVQRYPDRDKSELKRVAIDMLLSVGLDPDVFKKLPKELSGGMKQRCAIAQSFGINPPILLMDEPFGALDAVTRARLQDLIIDLWSKDEPKKTVFFVTHDVDEAMLLATRILVFGQSPSSVIYDCSLPYGKRMTRETQFDDPEVIKLRNTLIKIINADVERRISY